MKSNSDYIIFLQEQSRCISPVVVFRYSGERAESESSEGTNSSDEGEFYNVDHAMSIAVGDSHQVFA